MYEDPKVVALLKEAHRKHAEEMEALQASDTYLTLILGITALSLALTLSDISLYLDVTVWTMLNQF